MKAKVKWVEGFQFTGINERNAAVAMDAPPESGGEGAGMKPAELLLVALAGCTAIDVVKIMEKQKQQITGFTVEVEADQREEFPQSFQEIRLIYRVKGVDINENALKRAIELSEEKYCSVGATIRGIPENATIVHSYKIEQE